MIQEFVRLSLQQERVVTGPRDAERQNFQAMNVICDFWTFM